jgi:hypothetical protein
MDWGWDWDWDWDMDWEMGWDMRAGCSAASWRGLGDGAHRGGAGMRAMNPPAGMRRAFRRKPPSSTRSLPDRRR